MKQSSKKSQISEAVDEFQSYFQMGLSALEAFKRQDYKNFFDLLDVRDEIFNKFKALDNFLQVEYQIDIAQLEKVQIIWKDLNQVNTNIYKAIDQYKFDLHQKTRKLDYGLSAIERYHCLTDDDQEKFKRII